MGRQVIQGKKFSNSLKLNVDVFIARAEIENSVKQARLNNVSTQEE